MEKRWKVDTDRIPFKIWKKIPKQAVEKFGFWKELIEDEGPQSVRFYPGFSDHGLKGKRAGQRSSSLGYQWRVFYRVVKEVVTVVVLDISPHDY
jgi:toxin HigB-1